MQVLCNPIPTWFVVAYLLCGVIYLAMVILRDRKLLDDPLVRREVIAWWTGLALFIVAWPAFFVIDTLIGVVASKERRS